MADKDGDLSKFKRALDKQNELERAPGGPGKKRRDSAEGEAAQHGLGALDKRSKGRPDHDSSEQTATTRKSPQSTRSQSR